MVRGTKQASARICCFEKSLSEASPSILADNSIGYSLLGEEVIPGHAMGTSINFPAATVKGEKMSDLCQGFSA